MVDSGPVHLPPGRIVRLTRLAIPTPDVAFDLESRIFPREKLRRVIRSREAIENQGSARELSFEGLIRFSVCDLVNADPSFRPHLGECSARTPVVVDTGSEIFCVAPATFFPPGSLVPASKILSISAVNGETLGGGTHGAYVHITVPVLGRDGQPDAIECKNCFVYSAGISGGGASWLPLFEGLWPGSRRRTRPFGQSVGNPRHTWQGFPRRTPNFERPPAGSPEIFWVSHCSRVAQRLRACLSGGFERETPMR